MNKTMAEKPKSAAKERGKRSMDLNIKPEIHPLEEFTNEEPEVVLSNKGGPKLIYQGFMYTLHKRQPTSLRWRCVLRTHNCRGGLLTDTFCKQPYVRSCHLHPPDYGAAASARQRHEALGASVSLFGPGSIFYVLELCFN